VVRTLELAKKVNPEVLTVTGGQHFTATAQESLATYRAIDLVIRGEGERTLADLVSKVRDKESFHQVDGISFRHDHEVFHNPDRPLIEDLNELPYPGYHFVKDFVRRYHFAAMSGRNVPYAFVEGSRGCSHRCSFCTQWRHWRGSWRVKSPERIADEMEFCYQNYGSRFIWLTDDNFGPERAGRVADEILKRRIGDDLMLFVQWRCDDVVRSREVLPKMRRAGLHWAMVGVESPTESILKGYRKGITEEDARESIRLLKENDIFAHAMFVIGDRKDTGESIAHTREFVDRLNPDFAIFTALTPFPGTEIFEEAMRNGWIEDFNWTDYDMAHAIMPTETLSREEVQEELYRCYRRFFGSWGRRLGGILARNGLKRSTYRYMARRDVVRQFRGLTLAR
jgi:anaerobic magnesium-protoporphyrin IX monomethyl ester cyclase